MVLRSMMFGLGKREDGMSNKKLTRKPTITELEELLDNPLMKVKILPSGEIEIAECPDCPRLRDWVADLQGGMYINCVYCGHRYGPKESTPVSMADVLKAHIEKCPEHPLSKALVRIKELEELLEEAKHGEDL